MKFERYAGMASAVGIVLILTLIGWLGVAGPVWRAYWTASPDQWLGFAGAVVAGVMTIIAAIVAWFSVQQQIRAQQLASEHAVTHEKQERERQCAEAKHAAVIVLTQTVHAAAAVMNVTEQYLDKAHQRTATQIEEEARQRALKVIRENQKRTMLQLKATMGHFAIAQAWQQLDLDDRTNYLIVTSTLHTLINIYDNPPSLQELPLVSNRHVSLLQLGTYLEAFDSELARVYMRDAKI